jgi:hypothetical protein
MYAQLQGFCEVVSYLGDAGEQIDIPMPAIVYPVALWTGKQVRAVTMIYKYVVVHI